MNPYQVLGVSPDATEDQIKTAYRKLVKEYHPDQNKSDSAKVIIVRVNEAYEILTNAERRARYGRETYQPDLRSEEERDYEARKAEYFQRRKEREESEYKEMLIRDDRRFRRARGWAFPLLFVAVLLIADQLLPGKHYTESADTGWQQRTSGGKYGRGVLLSYMRTPHFVLKVPAHVHIDYDYYGKPGPIKIEVSPMFKVPKTILVKTAHHWFEFEAPGLYSFMIPLHYVLFFACVLTIWRRQYSHLNCVFAFFPPLILILIVFFWRIAAY
jgi:hypothetical protein